MSLIKFIKSRSFLYQIAFAIVTLILFTFIIFKWLNITTNHDQKIEVPSLEKMNLDNVEKTLSELDLNYVIIDSASYNPNFPKKSVIEQSPEAGDFVKEKRKIYLTLNPSGYKNIEIPNLFGKTKRQVTTQLTSVGFRIFPKYIYVSDIAKNVVRGMKYNGEDLKTGDKIPRNSIIELVLGDGKGRYPYRKSSNPAENE